MDCSQQDLFGATLELCTDSSLQEDELTTKLFNDKTPLHVLLLRVSEWKQDRHATGCHGAKTTKNATIVLDSTTPT